MDDMIEIAAEAAAEVIEDGMFIRSNRRKMNPFVRFLAGLAGAGAAGLLCYGIVTLLLY